MITQIISTLPPPPNSATDDSVTFPAKADAFTAALVTMGAEENTLAGQMNALAAAMNAAIAGGSFSIDYTFSTTIAVGDPGSGTLQLNNAVQNLATSMNIDVLASDGSDWTSAIDLFDDSTSAIKGFLILRKFNDGTKFLVFAITALAVPAGYRTVTASVVASSSANPFVNGDAVTLGFVRNGDKGDVGPSGPITPAQAQAQAYTAFTTAGTSTAYTLTPTPAIAAYAANQRFAVTFHTASGVNPTLQISGLASPPNLVKRNAGGELVNVKAGELKSGVYGVTLLSATQALVEGLSSAPFQANQLIVTTGLTLTAADCGKSFIGGNGAAATVNLPLANTCPPGSRLSFYALGAALTIARQSTDTINTGASLTSLVLNVSGRIVLENDGGTQWYAVSFEGSDRKWSDVTGSRAFATNFTNTTGRTISVACSVTDTVGGGSFGMQVTVAGVNLPQQLTYAASVGYITSLYFEVPAGAAYSITRVGSDASAAQVWAELR